MAKKTFTVWAGFPKPIFYAVSSSTREHVRYYHDARGPLTGVYHVQRDGASVPSMGYRPMTDEPGSYWCVETYSAVMMSVVKGRKAADATAEKFYEAGAVLIVITSGDSSV